MSVGKESACQCRRHKRHGFNPWVGKISWSRKWKPIPVFLLEKSHGGGAWKAAVHGVAKELYMTERLSTPHNVQRLQLKLNFYENVVGLLHKIYYLGYM